MKPGVRQRQVPCGPRLIHSTPCRLAPQDPARVSTRGAPAESEEDPALPTLSPAYRVVLGTSWPHARLSQARSATLEKGCIFQVLLSEQSPRRGEGLSQSRQEKRVHTEQAQNSSWGLTGRKLENWSAWAMLLRGL